MSATITPLSSRAGESTDEAHKASSPQGLDTARDRFVAEAATKIEQLQVTVQSLTRDVGELVGKVVQLQEACALEDRWYALHQSENRAKENKLDETVRGYRDLKGRLDKIEARSSGDYHSYSTFEAVSRKLARIEYWQDGAKRMRRRDQVRAWAFCAILLATTLVSLAAMLVVRFCNARRPVLGPASAPVPHFHRCMPWKKNFSKQWRPTIVCRA
jgi:hypothetical protein